MRRTDHEHLIERYLGGQMSGAEEEAFFIEVAIDSNLRQTLKAYRIVESALRKHRDSIPVDHTDSRLRLVAMLGTTVSAPQVVDNASSLPSSHRSLPGMGTWLISSIIAGTLISVTALLWNQPKIVNSTPPAPQRMELQSPASVTTTLAEPVAQPPSVVAEPATSDVEQESHPILSPSDTRSRDSHLSLSNESSSIHKHEVAGGPARQHQTKPISPAAVTDSASFRQTVPLLRSERSKPHVSSQDTIKMRMKIVLPDADK